MVPSAIVRLLGIRYALQGTALGLLPRRSVAAGACTVDVLHATSMYALAAARREYVKPALISAAAASANAVATFALHRGLAQRA